MWYIPKFRSYQYLDCFIGLYRAKNLICLFGWTLVYTFRHVHWIVLSTTNQMQHYTIFFIIVNAVHVPGGFSAHHQSSRTVHTASGMCQVCLLLLLVWLSQSSNSTTLAVAASKPGTYQMLCLQVLSSWLWAEKPPGTYRALTVIKNVV